MNKSLAWEIVTNGIAMLLILGLSWRVVHLERQFRETVKVYKTQLKWAEDFVSRCQIP